MVVKNQWFTIQGKSLVWKFSLEPLKQSFKREKTYVGPICMPASFSMRGKSSHIKWYIQKFPLYVVQKMSYKTTPQMASSYETKLKFCWLEKRGQQKTCLSHDIGTGNSKNLNCIFLNSLQSYFAYANLFLASHLGVRWMMWRRICRRMKS